MIDQNLFIFPSNSTLENLTDEIVHRLRIHFSNGYQLSIIRGGFSYGAEEGLYEICPFNKNGIMDGSILNIEGDDVQGGLSVPEVQEIINLMEAKL